MLRVDHYFLTLQHNITQKCRLRTELKKPLSFGTVNKPNRDSGSPMKVVGRWSPPAIIVLALVVAFVVFLFLDLSEQVFLLGASIQEIRVFHFLRGFLATSGGMLFVWQIMRCKELELTRLRDHFAEELDKRTVQLNDSLSKTQEQATRINAVMQSMAEAVLEIDGDGTILSANASFERMTHLPSVAIVGRPINEIIARFRPSPDAVPILSALADWRTARSDEAFYEVDDDRVLILHWALSPVDLPEMQGCVLTFTDISESRHLLDDLSIQREDFLEIINHRLRTPVLANIRANRLLLEGAFGNLQEAQSDIIQASLSNTEQLDRLLVMLIDVYKYRNNRKALQFETVAASVVAQDAVARFEKKSAAGNIAFRTEADAKTNAESAIICVDRQEFSKLLVHLIENAFKHARSSVLLSIECQQQTVSFVVRDDGPGLPEQDMRNLFDQFYKMSSTGRYSPTTGIGLCLCAQIARAHDAQLLCQSKADQGTEFCLILERKL